MFKKGQKVKGKTQRGRDIKGIVHRVDQLPNGVFVRVVLADGEIVSTRPSALALA